MADEPAGPASPYFAELEANFTPTPNQWYDEIMPSIKSICELKVTEVLIRQTFGWQRRSAQILVSCSDIAKLAGLDKPSAFKGLKLALQRGYVYRIPAGPQEFAYGIRVGRQLPAPDIQPPRPPSKPSTSANGWGTSPIV